MRRILFFALALCCLTAFAAASAEELPQAEENTVNATIIMESGEEIHLELYPDIAPNTTANFISLAQEGFYDGLKFHRVIEGFMIQGGCPRGIGTGGPGYAIEGEFSANGFDNPISHVRGVISMARSSDMDSAGSQFFIMHQDADYLDGQYAAFGRVTDEESMAVVDAIAETETNDYDQPVEEWKIRTIIVETNGVDYVPETIENAF